MITQRYTYFYNLFYWYIWLKDTIWSLGEWVDNWLNLSSGIFVQGNLVKGVTFSQTQNFHSHQFLFWPPNYTDQSVLLLVVRLIFWVMTFRHIIAAIVDFCSIVYTYLSIVLNKQFCPIFHDLQLVWCYDLPLWWHKLFFKSSHLKSSSVEMLQLTCKSIMNRSFKHYLFGHVIYVFNQDKSCVLPVCQSFSKRTGQSSQLSYKATFPLVSCIYGTGELQDIVSIENCHSQTPYIVSLILSYTYALF